MGETKRKTYGEGVEEKGEEERTRNAAGTLLETEEPPPEENASISGQNSKLSSHASLLSEMYTFFFFLFKMIPRSDISRTLRIERLRQFHFCYHMAFPGPSSAFFINVPSPPFRQINAGSPGQEIFRGKSLSRFHVDFISQN